MGASSILVTWDDHGVDWSSFGRVFISSTWDSVDRPIEYLTWIKRVSAVSLVINPAPVIEWTSSRARKVIPWFWRSS